VLTWVFAVWLHVAGMGHLMGHCGLGHGRLVCSKIGHGSTGLDRSTWSGVSHLRWCCVDQGMGAMLLRISTGFYETKKSITSQIQYRFKRLISMISGAGCTTIFPIHITVATTR
jgi:hypothetical protein